MNKKNYYFLPLYTLTMYTHISTHTNIHILSTIFFKLSNIEGKISLKQKSEKQKYLKIATSLRLWGLKKKYKIAKIDFKILKSMPPVVAPYLQDFLKA